MIYTQGSVQMSWLRENWPTATKLGKDRAEVWAPSFPRSHTMPSQVGGDLTLKRGQQSPQGARPQLSHPPPSTWSCTS